ncbi:hypothetical protein EUGRSUZ_A00207 [Eucalyptus grandis]|uniref:Uncharacterized protein n=2 Tax=Eucalyptus grandis TaxID=71139 RepID=A0ACC3M0K6_EUCGR|nr:hypothetical protein EUGRSUZ_A00207 [Eucalyptus grandis]
MGGRALSPILIKPSEAKILFLGLDNAGKTTLVRILKDERELDALLSYEALANVPFMVLGNKIDIPHAASEDELQYHLGLTEFTTGKGKVNFADQTVRPLEVFMCSVVRKMGYGEGLKWISQYIKY